MRPYLISNLMAFSPLATRSTDGVHKRLLNHRFIFYIFFILSLDFCSVKQKNYFLRFLFLFPFFLPWFPVPPTFFFPGATQSSR